MFKDSLEKIRQNVNFYGNRYEEVLKFFKQQKSPMTLKELSIFLDLNELSIKRIVEYLSDDQNKLLRRVKNDVHNEIYEITLDGLRYLRDLELQQLHKKQTTFNMIIATTSVFLAICSLISLIVSLYK